MDGRNAHLRLVHACGEGGAVPLQPRTVAAPRERPHSASAGDSARSLSPRAATATASDSGLTGTHAASASSTPVQLATKSRDNSAAACIVPHPRGSVAPSHREPALDPSDARWVLAVLCWEWMDGGSAAILTPAKRDKLMRAADSMRLRRFDAGLIIAIAQDERRRGGASLSRLAAARLALVAPPAQMPRTSFIAASLSALSLAGVMIAILVMWVQGT